jgi:flavin-dependent dehydrogenase
MIAPNLQARYDVVVLGGGPSGTTAAAALARQSLAVLIVEAQEAVPFKVGESIPGIAGSVLARAGFPGVLRKVAQLKCSGNRSYWGSSEEYMRSGLLDPYGGGAHLDRAQFDRELLSESVASGAQMLSGVRFDRGTRSKNGWTMLLRSGANRYPVECDSVIDCTGRRSCFARTQGAKRIVVDRQVAIVSVLSGDNIADSDLTTTIEATHDGWWYSTRIPNQKRVVVFCSDGSLLPGLRARTSEGFAHLMCHSTHIREFLDRGYGIGRNPEVVLADTSYLTHSADDGWCAAGDAAAALDPLASAGIVNAIQSGSAAARLVLSGFKNCEEYSKMVGDRVKADIETRRSYYLMETRWPREPFWVRRRETRRF